MSFYNTANWPDKSKYYRWPWSNNDNPVGWLEITDLCNIYCKGCYRSTSEGHRPLDVLKKEVDFFIKVRNIDTVCIAGGEPLIYPYIIPLVKYIADKGLKANIITNTNALTEELARDLYRAGVFGFTCHIDMLQDRPERKPGFTEIDLLELRKEKGELLYKIGKGKIYCTFNFTVYHENFQYIPDIVRWARQNTKIVSGLDFITYRGIPIKEGLSYNVEESDNDTVEEIQNKISYTVNDTSQIDITSVDIYNLLKDNFGDLYEPSAYLGGTGHIKEYKWWGEACVMEKNGKVYGSVGPRTMEFLQITQHFFKKKYFMYLKRSNKISRLEILLTALINDSYLRKARWRILGSLFNPVNWFRPLYSQSIGINQPPDLLENGMTSMCESCPDACIFEDNLVSSCRLDEYKKYGRLMAAVVHEQKKKDNIESVKTI